MYIKFEDNMKVPLKVFSKESSIESQCIEQMQNVCKLPFLYKYVALMPDWHLWIWASIGSVVPTKWVVIPALVWVDIWCWMCAVKTSLTDINKDVLKKIMGHIREEIPVWMNRHKEIQDFELMPKWNSSLMDNYPIVYKNYENALTSLGTLWWWNHFIEIQKWNDWYIRIMIHSWSRNLWLQVAKHYNDLAKELNKKRHSDTQKDLAFLPIDSEEWQSYIKEMNYCVEYAFANRKLMIDKVKDIIFEICFLDKKDNKKAINFDPIINIAHNYARLENHWENVMVHRKGATSAKDWEIGIIPWSQWTKSYIVKWKWNKESFMSCSHWAGRKLGRKNAKETLNLEDEKKKLDEMWVIHSVRTLDNLDESPWAYKDIDMVMEEQKDLVDIVVELTPLWVIKG